MRTSFTSTGTTCTWKKQTRVHGIFLPRCNVSINKHQLQLSYKSDITIFSYSRITPPPRSTLHPPPSASVPSLLPVPRLLDSSHTLQLKQLVLYVCITSTGTRLGRGSFILRACFSVVMCSAAVCRSAKKILFLELYEFQVLLANLELYAMLGYRGQVPTSHYQLWVFFSQQLQFMHDKRRKEKLQHSILICVTFNSVCDFF